MRAFLLILCLNLFSLFFDSSLSARDVRALESRVTDEVGIISNEKIQAWEEILSAWEKERSDQIAIYIIPSLDGEVLEEYSLKVAETTKLGQSKEDNGILLLIVIEDRKARIEVGYGLEGVLTDVYCKRLLRNGVIPFFKEQRYEEGIDFALQEIFQVLENGESPPEPSWLEIFQTYPGIAEEAGFFMYIIGPFVMLILGMFAFLFAFHKEVNGIRHFIFIWIFFLLFPWILFGYTFWLVCNITYFILFIFVRLTRDRWKPIVILSDKITNNVHYTEGGINTSIAGYSSSGDSGFSGGGGSFGGGGASDSW
ncbi:hypothetical protein LPTSP4_18420 [Leptospira ryugenii]|uniref:TPM domain-containing protein n=1 Tax=Leptospira ryugenii TaxID=1917863 RepID=A0A2P2E093_9LEPT|nr:TPM domain-containing protein [Leptospira ryugenii]GBF50317.1 hypothetical protein LPTSP4_18420 [Leptospira ryugenii]